MAIYDCFQFFNEEHILDLRFNLLNEFVDFFVIVESTIDHQGNSKKLNFDSNKFKTSIFFKWSMFLNAKLFFFVDASLTMRTSTFSFALFNA